MSLMPSNLKPISPLRARMIEDMMVRNFGAPTQRKYIRAVKKLACFIGGGSPDSATAEELRAFQAHLTKTGTKPPTMSPPLRARRLLALTLRDFRQLAVKPGIPPIADWIGKVAARLSALPDQAKLIQFARLGTALSEGAELIRLRSLASRIGFAALLDPAFEAIAHGQSQAAIEHLAKAGAALSQPGNNGESSDIKVRARASILRLSEALSRHGAYFDGRALV
jgi:hypothetical protein